MKKFLLLFLAVLMAFSSFPVQADENVTVVLDGNELNCTDVNGTPVFPILQDGTTYLPVRALSEAMNLSVEWDGNTQSVFINGTPENAEKGDSVSIYINGKLFVAKDVTGKVVTPILKDGTTYLPVRAIGEAFNKRVSWEQATKTVFVSSPVYKLDFDENLTYAIVNKANGKAISVTDSGLVVDDFNSYTNQAFKFTPSGTEGYYYITAVSNNKNFDVNGNSKSAGGTIITYNPGTADNQKFAVELYNGSYIIYSLSSRLPIEDSAGKIKQNNLRDSVVQQWEIVEITPTQKEDDTTYFLLTYGAKALFDSPEGVSLKSFTTLSFAAYDHSRPDSPYWALIPNEDGEYIITNKATGKSLDVANNSTQWGDSVITYTTSGDANQRWIIENVELSEYQPSKTYLIQSVHSKLYLTEQFGKICQWTMTDDPSKLYWAIYRAN